LSSYKDGLEYSICHAPHLSAKLRDKALTLLKGLPDGSNVCHGDYHPGNVLLTRQGPMAIDWMTAKSGNRWADVSRTRLLLSIGARSAGKQVKPIVRVMVGLFLRMYLNHYRALSPDSQEVPFGEDRWLPVTAAARLNEDMVPEREALLKMIDEG
jgi:hypothetical protein